MMTDQPIQPDQPDSVAIAGEVLRRAMLLVSTAWGEQHRTGRPLGPDEIKSMQDLIDQDGRTGDPALPPDCRIMLSTSDAAGTFEGRDMPGLVLTAWCGNNRIGVSASLMMTSIKSSRQPR